MQNSHLDHVDAQLEECAAWIQKNGKDLARNYPEVHTAIQTKFAAQNLLNFQKEEIEHLLHKGFFDEAEHSRVLSCCEGSLNVLFHTSFASLVDKKADSESIFMQSPLFQDLSQGERTVTKERAEKSECYKKEYMQSIYKGIYC